MKTFSGLIVGIIFGLGLILSGMTNPAKVTGFLDLAGNWDPSLALVMGGAILVGLAGFRIAKTRETSLLGEDMRLPTESAIDRQLIIGGLIFGAGWGLSGYCPGPAVASLLSGGIKPIAFTLSMLAGMLILKLIQKP